MTNLDDELQLFIFNLIFSLRPYLLDLLSKCPCETQIDFDNRKASDFFTGLIEKAQYYDGNESTTVGPGNIRYFFRLVTLGFFSPGNIKYFFQLVTLGENPLPEETY